MSDISITAANVAKGANASTQKGTAGATITAGQSIRLDTSDNLMKLADNDVSLAAATVAGIALCGASSGQPIEWLTGGNINPGGTVTVGEIYVLSSNAGGICPEGDLGSGDYVSVIGIGTTSSNISVKIHNSGAQVPAP